MDAASYGQDIVTEILSEKPIPYFRHEALYSICCLISKFYPIPNENEWRKCEYEEKV